MENSIENLRENDNGMQQLECHYTDEISINVIAIENDDDDFFRGERLSGVGNFCLRMTNFLRETFELCIDILSFTHSRLNGGDFSTLLPTHSGRR